MAAVRYELVIEQGATFELPITWYADDKRTKPINLTGYTARMQIRTSADPSSTLLYDSGGSNSRLIACLSMMQEGRPLQAGIQDVVFNRVQNWLKYGWADNSSGETRWSMDRLLDAGITKFSMMWIWGMLDAGYNIGPYDATWDPAAGTNINPNPPAFSGCSPITEDQHRTMVGTSYVNQIRAELGLGTARRNRIEELFFYQGCVPMSEASGSLPGDRPDYDKYLDTAQFCGAKIIFDAEPPTSYSSSLPQAVLRQRMADLGLKCGNEPLSQKTASAASWLNGLDIIFSSTSYWKNSLNRPEYFYQPRELRAAGKRYIEYLDYLEPAQGSVINKKCVIARTKQLIVDGYEAAIIFGFGGEVMTPEEVADLVLFDRENAANGHITIGGESGTVTVKIPPGVTKALAPTGTAVYDILLTSPSGEVTRLVEGPVSIRPDVTDPDA